MGKQWLYLVFAGFVLLVGFFIWDLYSSFSGQRDDFSFTLVPIETNLYDGVETHFQNDPDYSEYEQTAESIESIEYFRPPEADVSVSDEVEFDDRL